MSQRKKKQSSQRPKNLAPTGAVTTDAKKASEPIDEHDADMAFWSASIQIGPWGKPIEPFPTKFFEACAYQGLNKARSHGEDIRDRTVTVKIFLDLAERGYPLLRSQMADCVKDEFSPQLIKLPLAERWHVVS